jgi:hypothetical protein
MQGNASAYDKTELQVCTFFAMFFVCCSAFLYLLIQRQNSAE